MIDQLVELLDALSRESGNEHQRRIREEFQFAAHHGLVIGEQLAGITARAFASGALFLGGFFLRRLEGEIPLIHHDNDGAARIAPRSWR